MVHETLWVQARPDVHWLDTALVDRLRGDVLLCWHRMEVLCADGYDRVNHTRSCILKGCQACIHGVYTYKMRFVGCVFNARFKCIDAVFRLSLDDTERNFTLQNGMSALSLEWSQLCYSSRVVQWYEDCMKDPSAALSSSVMYNL